jgi:uncharacterized protein with HEPN domain
VRDDSQRVEDILEAILRIERYSEAGREEFLRNELIQTWFVHYIQLIGEAVRSLSDATRQLQPEVPWNQIVGMRHILVHQYFGVDLDLVWNVIINDLPTLKTAIQTLATQIPRSEDNGSPEHAS